MAWFNVPFISPFAWGSGQSVAPSNTNPTRRFSISRQGTIFTADGTSTTFKSKAVSSKFSTDSGGTHFTPDDAGRRFTGDE